MAELPVVSDRQVGKVLAHLGFSKLRKRGKGSHSMWRHSDGRQTTVPHQKELRKGTLGSILKQVDATSDEFVAALRDV